MRKKCFFIAIITIFMSMPLVTSLPAEDNSNDQPFEKKRLSSAADCREFVKNFKSGGVLEDKETFEQQFGLPLDSNVPFDVDGELITTYNYDDFTKIKMDCTGGKCTFSCASKY